MGTTVILLTESEPRLVGSEQVKHTPGPWTLESGETYTVRSSDDGSVCQLKWLRGRHGMGGRRDDGEVMANAHLIAAAPDMLEALKPLAFCDARQPPYGVEVDDWTGAVEAARVALSKAQGRTP